MALVTLLCALFAGAFTTMAVLYFKQKQYLADALARYSPIIDLEAEQSRLSAANQWLQDEIAGFQQRSTEEHAKILRCYRDDEAAFLAKDNRNRASLCDEYQKALSRYEDLKKEISIAEDSLEDMSFGIYKPHFTFQTTAEYKARIDQLRSQQKEVVRDGRAATCPIQWTVNNSKTEGKRMIRLHSKLLLRFGARQNRPTPAFEK